MINNCCIAIYLSRLLVTDRNVDQKKSNNTYYWTGPTNINYL